MISDKIIFIDTSNVPFRFVSEECVKYPDNINVIWSVAGSISKWSDNVKLEWYFEQHLKGEIVYDLRNL